MEVPYLAIKIVSQYSPLLISTLHLAFPFALSQRKYFQQNAFLLLETSSNWSSLNMEIESENKFTNFILKKKKFYFLALTIYNFNLILKTSIIRQFHEHFSNEN